MPVVAEINGVQTELDEARPAGKVRFLFVRNRLPLRPSVAATDAGIQRGQAEDFEAALTHFQRAEELDPFNRTRPTKAVS